MRVQIAHTLEVSDEQRKQIATIIDGPDAANRRRRDATRDEMKTFIWEHGDFWETYIRDYFTDKPHGGVLEGDDILGITAVEDDIL